jgi:hypothetical protein
MGLSVTRFSWVLGLVCSVLSGCFALQRAVLSFGIDIWVQDFRDQRAPLDYDHECAFRSQNIVLGKSAFRHGLSGMGPKTSLSGKNLGYTTWIEKRFSSGKSALMD